MNWEKYVEMALTESLAYYALYSIDGSYVVVTAVIFRIKFFLVIINIMEVIAVPRVGLWFCSSIQRKRFIFKFKGEH